MVFKDYILPSFEYILLPCNYQLSKSIVHEIKFGDSCHVNINNLPYSDRYFNTDRQDDCKARKDIK